MLPGHMLSSCAACRAGLRTTDAQLASQGAGCEDSPALCVLTLWAYVHPGILAGPARGTHSSQCLVAARCKTKLEYASWLASRTRCAALPT
jgi:hypothetical protein